MKPNLPKLLKARDIKRAELARAMGLNRSQITRWEQNGVPASRVVEVERVTGIPRYKLRPDLYA